MSDTSRDIAALLLREQEAVREEWLAGLNVGGLGSRIPAAELTAQARELQTLLLDGLQAGKLEQLDAHAWADAADFLSRISASRVLQGFASDETATFVFSLKRPLFALLRREFAGQPERLVDTIWATTQLLDFFGLLTVRAFQRSREAVIERQQQDLLELSTPVVKLWEGVLALPMIGTLDSARTQIVMESLLQRIVETGSEIAIIDITGVPTVDTLVAQHLLKTVTAIRLMGADCIISGIRPQIAQTIVHLGVELGDIATKATLADALSVALKRSGFTISRSKG